LAQAQDRQRADRPLPGHSASCPLALMARDMDDKSTKGLPAGQEDRGQVGCMFGCGLSVVPSGSVGVVQQCGEYVGYQEPGCMLYCPCICNVRPVSLAVRQIQCRSDCKTKDNVTLSVLTAVQYRINKSMVKTAIFDIVDPTAQIQSQVDDILRSTLPTLDLDEAYECKDRVCKALLGNVRQHLGHYGYEIINVLVTDLRPEKSVLDAMNMINASKRQRQAAIEKGEADKVLKVKAAEAEAEAKYLSGVGVARMRKAMADGFKDSMNSMSQSGLSPPDTMHMMMTTQYLDTLKEFAANDKSSAIMVPTGPTSKDIEAQVRDGFIASSAVSAAARQNMPIAAPAQLRFGG